MSWEQREHTADLKVRFEAASLRELFGDATDLVRTLVAGETAAAADRAERAISLEATAPDELLFRYLRELLFLFNTERLVPASLEIRSVSRTALDATLRGEPFDPARHEPQPEVKAVTRHGLSAEKADGRWTAEVVFDL